MSHKNLDCKGRLRSLTIAFRVSPEENEDLNMRVRLSGLTKQDYIIRRCQERDVIVYGNPRVYKALKGQLSLVLSELKRLSSADAVPVELLDTIHLIADILSGMKGSSSTKT